MKMIPLTQGKIALVDDADYPELSKFKWFAQKSHRTYYAGRRVPSGILKPSQKTIRMHMVIAGTPQGMETDHINGNGLDNRRENLRVVTRRENQQNRHETKSSRFLGVSWDKQHRKWRAYIRVAGKNYHLGRYENEEAAARRYRIACDWQVMDMEVCKL